MKKIVEVPDNATSMRVTFENAKALGVTNFKVADLPDVPTVAKIAIAEKRVIELPADVIKGIEKAKNMHESNIYYFLEDYPIDDLLGALSTDSIGQANLLVTKWYLGQVDFVAKKETHFVLAFPNKVTSSLDMRYLQIINNGYAINNVDDATKLTDADIDELAEKFPEINFDALEKVEVEG